MEHSGHDIEQLLSRWEKLARANDWETIVLAEAGGYPVCVFQNRKSGCRENGGLYVSSGVHGDECAPPWGLLRWAESNPPLFDEVPLVVIPCFNPVGFVENTRSDGDRVDLNRHFQNRGLPLMSAWQDFLKGREFSMALNLHEDYDATGIYLYEIASEGSPGGSFLSSCQDLIPRETAPSVDGVEFRDGLLSHDVDESRLREMVEENLDGGMPEAVYLYLNHALNSFTFETPSEMDLRRRIETHQRFLEVAAAHLLEGKNRSLDESR
ncbi:MAG: M14 family metallocarboxypeptidase [Verrucomicrobiales bacterium]|nr:M14 family metallocarboxypeptidase [Verrucomicrobiales bacterium]